MESTNVKPEYGNWIPRTLIIGLWAAFAISIAAFVLVHLYWGNLIGYIAAGLLAVVTGLFAVLYTYMRGIFSFEGGNMMGHVHEKLLDTLPWDGEGSIIDIGCGSGALSIRAAKKFPQAQVQGIDYWGAGWDYAKDQCESNARIEGVTNVRFDHGDASKLDFEDGTFDAAVSNFVFHEVRGVSDKKTLVTEALRVVKAGGAFCFNDLFENRSMYGDMAAFVEELRAQGHDVHYLAHTENDPVYPKAVRGPLMMNNLGVLYGRKKE